MSGHTRLYRRGATYYHRAAIPVDLQGKYPKYPKTEETFSLRTKDYNEALKRVRIAAVEVDRKFDAHRRLIQQQERLQSQPALKELSKEDIRKVGETYYAFLLQEDEDSRFEHGFYKGGELEVDDGRVLTNDDGPAPTFQEHVETTEALDGADRQAQAMGEVLPFYESEAEEVLSWSGIRLEKNSPSLKAVARQLQAASLRATKAIKERNEGEIVDTPDAEMVSPYSQAPLFSQARDEWFKVKKAENTWKNPRTPHQYRTYTARFISIIGDKPINQYTKSDGRMFRDIITALPSNIDKRKELKGIPLKSIPKKAEQLGLEPMSITNVNNHIVGVSALWKWIEENYDEEPSNPLKGMKYKVKANPRKERDPFTAEELTTIFNTPVYTGCKSYKGWKESGTYSLIDSYRFWLPLICLFSGMRQQEACQLYTEDIQEEDGIHFFYIHENRPDMSIKNPHSERRIPVHQELVRIGFMDLVKQRVKQGEPRIFPDLKMSSDGTYSKNASMHFQRFFKKAGVKHGKNCFHSFRHSFEDACRESNVPEAIMHAIQAHKEGNMSDRYGRGFSIKKLNENMQELQYPDLDLSHLRR